MDIARVSRGAGDPSRLGGCVVQGHPLGTPPPDSSNGNPRCLALASRARRSPSGRGIILHMHRHQGSRWRWTAVVRRGTKGATHRDRCSRARWHLQPRTSLPCCDRRASTGGVRDPGARANPPVRADWYQLQSRHGVVLAPGWGGAKLRDGAEWDRAPVGQVRSRPANVPLTVTGASFALVAGLIGRDAAVAASLPLLADLAAR